MAEEIEFEYDIKTVPVDEQFQATVEQFQKDGWLIVQGVKPVTIYHCIRPKHRVKKEEGGLGVIQIDDSKVMILRKDGTIDRGAGPIVGPIA
jgi:hypothetical protein